MRDLVHCSIDLLEAFTESDPDVEKILSDKREHLIWGLEYRSPRPASGRK
jgi:hypothetical protein